MSFTFTNTGPPTVPNSVETPTPQTVVDTWLIPGGTTNFSNTYRRVGNATSGYTVHWAMTRQNINVGVAAGLIQSPIGSIPPNYRPNSPVGYIIAEGNGSSGGVPQTLRIIIANNGLITITREDTAGLTGSIDVGGWHIIWDTSMPDL